MNLTRRPLHVLVKIHGVVYNFPYICKQDPSKQSSMKKIPLFALLTLFISCDKFEHHMSIAYVPEYYQMEAIEVVQSNNHIVIYANGLSDYASITDEDPSTFNALAEKHNDTSYNKRITYLETILQDMNPCCLKDDFTTIHITSNADFDESHPAGSLLDDIVIFHSSTPYPYIQSGYTSIYQWGIASNMLPALESTYQRNIFSCMEEAHYVRKKVSELVPSDLTLLGDKWTEACLGIIEFIAEPTLHRHHTMNIKMVTDEGHIYENLIEITFD